MEEFPGSILNEENYSRFDQRENVFSRIDQDEESPFYGQEIYDRTDSLLTNREGYDSFKLARTLGGWSVYDYHTEAFRTGESESSSNNMDKPTLDLPTSDPEKITAELKNSALAYGAEKVGITKVDPRWVYAKDRQGKELDHLLEYDYAVVMLVPMDPEGIKKSPGLPAATASAVSYSQMAFVISCLKEYINRLGYSAAPMGNGGALSIPLAVGSGLGRLGRNGLLLNPDLGSSLKICKVFTDMPLAEDQPLSPQLEKSCQNCKICSEACEVDAISSKTEPREKIACPANNHGLKRWAVDHYSCYEYWLEIGSDCSSCIAACPFTPNQSSD